MASTRRRRISLLGLLSILGGAAGLASMFQSLPWLGTAPVGLGTLGLIFGALALLIASLLGHSGLLIPLIGLLLSAGALGWGEVQGPRSDRVTQQFTAIVRAYSGHSAPSSTPPPPAGNQPQHPAAAADGNDQSPHHHSIFEDDSTGSGSATNTPAPAISPSAASDNASRNTAINNVPPPSAVPTQRLQIEDAQHALITAKSRWDVALTNVTKSVSQSPAYVAAGAEVKAAEQALADARAANEPGSPALMQASRRWLDAKSALQRVIDQAVNNDSIATAAKQEWSKAASKLAALKSQATGNASSAHTSQR